MSKKQIKKLAKAYVKELTAKVVAKNPDAFAMHLVSEGISFAMAAREHRKALVEQKVDLPKHTGTSELKAVREEVAEDERDAPTTYSDLAAWAAELEDKFPINFNSAMKVIKADLKDNEIEIPSKVKLGSVKEAIAQYFAANDERSLSGLTDHIAKTVTVNNADEDKDDLGDIVQVPISKDKAIHNARMYYTFCELIANGQTVADVNEAPVEVDGTPEEKPAKKE